jgi:hypothetical protein
LHSHLLTLRNWSWRRTLPPSDVLPSVFSCSVVVPPSSALVSVLGSSVEAGVGSVAGAVSVVVGGDVGSVVGAGEAVVVGSAVIKAAVSSCSAVVSVGVAEDKSTFTSVYKVCCA